MALYVIPTGSMQPTLHGKGDYPAELGDKVLVNKFIYRFEKPKRWDVIVFEFPYRSIVCNRCQNDVMREIKDDAPSTIPEDLVCRQLSCQGKPKDLDMIRKDYIKRCVAVPGDEVSVRDGNIVLKENGVWKPSKKTELAQDALWVPVFDSSNADHMSVLDHFWKGGPALMSWRHGAPVEFAAGAEQTMLFYQKEFLRGHGDKGDRGGPLPMGAPFVGDVKMELDLDSFPQNGILELEISRNYVPHILSVDFATKKIKVKVSNKTLSELSLSATKTLSFSRVDGHLWVGLDDAIHTYEIEGRDHLNRTGTIMPKIRYKGDKFQLENIRLARDIFYQGEGSGLDFFTGLDRSYKVMPGEYFAMGDNSYHSYDGRMWGAVPEEKLIGKALTVLLPFSRIKLIY